MRKPDKPATRLASINGDLNDRLVDCKIMSFMLVRRLWSNFTTMGAIQQSREASRHVINTRHSLYWSTVDDMTVGTLVGTPATASEQQIARSVLFSCTKCNRSPVNFILNQMELQIMQSDCYNVSARICTRTITSEQNDL